MESHEHESGRSVCLIGTSNGVFADGYAKAFKTHHTFSRFENRSIGFCSSALFAYQYAAIDFSKYDLCFLDFACNDASLFASEILTERDIRTQLEFAISTISTSGCVPVLLIFPIRKSLPDGGKVREIYLSVAHEHRVPYFDGYEFLKRFEAYGFAAVDQFADDMHLSREIARLLGEYAAQAVDGLLATRADGDTKQIDGFHYRCITADHIALPHENLTTYVTSLVAASCAAIGDVRIAVTAQPAEEVSALVVNFATSVGVLNVEGKTATSMRLTSEHYVPGKTGLVFGIFPLYPPVPEEAVRFTLSMHPDALADVNCSRLALRNDTPAASLIGLIVRRPARIGIRHHFHSAINIFPPGDDTVVRDMLPKLGENMRDKIIEGIYRGMLDRFPDPAGRDKYRDMLEKHGIIEGMSLVIKTTLSSQEFKSRKG